jgi:stringent starvation protein B
MTDGPAPGMTSRRPYLLRAMYEWIADNGMTPHLLVDASRPGVRVPAFAVNDGKVVLNVAARAVAALDMGNEEISFTARFGGVSHQVRVPVGAVLLIYARETSQGMALPDEVVGASAAADGVEVEEDLDGDADGGDDGGDSGGDGGNRTPPSKRGGHLRVVK